MQGIQFRDGIPMNSWWYQFKYTHPRLTIKLVHGLEVCRTHGLINETCKSFYQNLTTLYI